MNKLTDFKMSDHIKTNDDFIEYLRLTLEDGVTNRDQANDLLAQCYNLITDMQSQIPDDRTEAQSSSRWVYLRELAKQLNDAGIDRVKLLETLRKSPKIDIPNDETSLYAEYWGPIKKAMYPGKSRPSKVEISKIYETMNRHTAQTFGISLPWPDRFNRK